MTDLIHHPDQVRTWLKQDEWRLWDVQRYLAVYEHSKKLLETEQWKLPKEHESQIIHFATLVTIDPNMPEEEKQRHHVDLISIEYAFYLFHRLSEELRKDGGKYQQWKFDEQETFLGGLPAVMDLFYIALNASDDTNKNSAREEAKKRFDQAVANVKKNHNLSGVENRFKELLFIALGEVMAAFEISRRESNPHVTARIHELKEHAAGPEFKAQVLNRLNRLFQSDPQFNLLLIRGT